MAKRVIGESASATVYARIPPSLKNKMDSAADAAGLSTTKWLIEAIQEKLDPNEAHRNSNLEARVESLERLFMAQSGTHITQTAGRDAQVKLDR